MSKKKRFDEEHIIDLIGLIAVFFFIVFGFLAVVLGNKDYVFDRFFTAGLIFFIWLLHKRFHLKLWIFIVILFAITLHHLKLYGMFFFGIPFDRIMHFTAGFAIALLVYQYIKTNCHNLTKWEIFFIAIFAAAGIASMMEIIEFVGYSFLGEGEGILFYGTGDFGEWNNACWDLICNTSGALIGSLSMMFIQIKKKIKK